MSVNVVRGECVVGAAEVEVEVNIMKMLMPLLLLLLLLLTMIQRCTAMIARGNPGSHASCSSANTPIFLKSVCGCFPWNPIS